ncbi:MAG: DUF2182 domain-containing protein [Thermoanaerobaculia bacterium]
MLRERAFVAVNAILFAASVAGTIALCRSMPGGMAMPGGWTMSMAWMRMPAQSWLGAAAMFLVMWGVMMVAMMLPSLAWVLRHPRYKRWLVATAYFFVWTVVGALTYALGVALTTAEMRSEALARSVPVATGVVLLIAGLMQVTPWKARHLACCRDCTIPMSHDTRGAWNDGVRLGVHCVLCCSGLMATLLVLGVMNLAAMTAVAAAITLERIGPDPERVAPALGIVMIAAGAIVTLH